MTHFYKYLILFILPLLCCSNQADKSEEYLVRIGDRVITAEEFINRAELTPRPFYCRSGSEDHKIIALNAIIAEKLFALEEGEQSELLLRPSFQAYIKGRKEQYMRDELFDRITRPAAQLDEAEIDSSMQLAGYIYNVEFYTINSNELAKKLEQKLTAKPDSAALIFDEIDISDSVPRRTVKFKDPDHPVIHHALYSKKLDTGKVVGPLKLQENQHIIMKVADISYTPALSESEALDRKRFVKERLVERKSNAVWNKFVSKIMRGKEIRFVPQTTVKVAELYSKKDVPPDKQEQLIQKRHEEDNSNLSLINLTTNETLMATPLLKVNDKVWTVADFRKLLLSHPLVFRKPDYAPSEYLEQFKLAVIDLIRDYYLTEEAYEQSIDQSGFVQRNVAMWRDSFAAKFHRESYLKSLAQADDFDKKRMRGSYTYIDEYADKLQKKYSNQIEIDMDKFNEISLTSTDMYSVRQFVPYQLTVPGFPKLCVDGKLDYGVVVQN